MHNKILVNAGFYLMLLFALTVTVFPKGSYFLAAAIFAIWLVDAFIFRDLNLSEHPLFYPVISFNAFLILGWFLAWLFGANFDMAHIGLLSLFYFVVPGFVITGEQRRMVLWTFITGAMLLAGLHLVSWWSAMPNFGPRFRPLIIPSSFLVALAFCVVISFFAESPRLKDKLFYFLISLPLILVIIFSGDNIAITIMLFALVSVGLLIDRKSLIPLALTLILFFTGIFEIRYIVERNVNFDEFTRYIANPAKEIAQNKENLLKTGFYGIRHVEGQQPLDSDTASSSFFLRLVTNVGPPAIFLFGWILFERFLESYFKRRRVNMPHARAYHLTVMLFIGAIIIGNLYGSVFDYPAIILSFWLITGIYEI